MNRSIPVLAIGIAAATSLSAGCSSTARETALHSYALDLCKTTQHVSGNECPAQVDANFSRCSEPFLAQKITSEAFAECLGFVLPPPVSAPRVLAACAVPRFRAHLSLSVAQATSWEDAARRDVNGRSLFVSTTPTVTEADVRAARLEDSDAGRMLTVELTPDAAKKLEHDTATHVGQVMVLGLNGREMAITIGSALPGPTLSMGAAGMKPDDVCAP